MRANHELYLLVVPIYETINERNFFFFHTVQQLQTVFFTLLRFKNKILEKNKNHETYSKLAEVGVPESLALPAPQPHDLPT